MRKMLGVVVMIGLLSGFLQGLRAQREGCTTHTYMIGGKMVNCITCCSSGHCTTSCF